MPNQTLVIFASEMRRIIILDRIRIRIIFVFQNQPNTNTNNIRFSKMDEYEYEYYSFLKNGRIRIRILFVSEKWTNTNTNSQYSNIIRIIFEYRIIRLFSIIEMLRILKEQLNFFYLLPYFLSPPLFLYENLKVRQENEWQSINCF